MDTGRLIEEHRPLDARVDVVEQATCQHDAALMQGTPVSSASDLPLNVGTYNISSTKHLTRPPSPDRNEGTPDRLTAFGLSFPETQPSRGGQGTHEGVSSVGIPRESTGLGNLAQERQGDPLLTRSRWADLWEQELLLLHPHSLRGDR